MTQIPTAAGILNARERIVPFINHTPVLTSERLDERTGASLFFKCENLQKVGAFKMRGAMNAVLSLSDADRAKGVATHSSGNHAQALSRAAKLMEVPAYIVMPRTAPEIKKKGVRYYGGQIFECEPTLAARESTLAEVVAKTGAVEIHPFNNYEVIAGQATAALELFEEIAGLDALITPVGGGGLLSGTLLATRYFSPGTQVFAAEPEAANDAFRSVQSGRIEAASPPTSIADGLLTSLGDKTFPLIQEMVKEVITVTEDEIRSAMRILWEELKVVVEPSSSVVLAALLKRPDGFRGKQVGLILSGGNVDMKRAMELMISVPA
jgi:threonine dehydratase